MVEPFRFRNREDAGRVLAQRLRHYAHRPDVIVLALPRGGVPVGFEVAATLHAPLDIFVVRKLGVPGHPELAMGAIASGGVRVVSDDVVQMLGIAPDVIDAVAREEERELQRRETLYRGDRPRPRLKNRIVILVDDGLATGSTMRAAAQAIRQLHPSRIVVAVPVAARRACDALRSEVNEVICVMTPASFSAVGRWYDEFPQTSDDEVRDQLKRSQGQLTAP